MIRKTVMLVIALHLAGCQTVNEPSDKVDNSFEQLLEDATAEHRLKHLLESMYYAKFND